MAAPLISHVGIAVENLDAAIRRYRLLLGVDPVHVVDVPDQKVRVAIFPASGYPGGRFELLQATSSDSLIARFISKRGEGLHHLCIYVDDVGLKLEELKAAGLQLIDESPRIGAEGNRIAFVHPGGANGVLIELEERRGKSTPVK
ncbi:MAG: methylmalonyl-CoA epimerase [candidate division Zixibacteria bacterium]|nr:methylmalonyl-CoA epimerase [candidate division Zixibacteria bacterium]